LAITLSILKENTPAKLAEGHFQFYQFP